jgi:phosphoglucosamine mutase
LSQRRYFGTDGIRGRVGEGSINPEFMLKLGWAAGRVLGHGAGGKVLIGKDTRISGYMFESALEAGLAAAGVNIRLLGPMPTPGIAYLTRTFRASAGIVISASHNPYDDNGVKFFSGEGDKLPDAVEQAIEAELERPMTTVPSDQIGKAKRVDDAPGRYVEFCKSTIPTGMNFRGLRLVLDCANGATYHVAPHVFEELGARVLTIGAEPDGLNINAGVGSTHPETLCRAVVGRGADLGIAFDGDGDRVLMVDATGRLVDGDQLLYVIACARQAAGELVGPVVGTLMSNLGLELALRGRGLGFVRTQVGDRYILERLKEDGGVLGGEPSGHIICRDRTSTGDGIIAALQVLAGVQSFGRGVAELATEVERFPQYLVNVRLTERVEVVSRPAIAQAVRAVEADLNGQGRVLLRASGTEPLIRVMVEGRDDVQVRALAQGLAEKVRAEVACA